MGSAAAGGEEGRELATVEAVATGGVGRNGIIPALASCEFSGVGGIRLTLGVGGGGDGDACETRGEGTRGALISSVVPSGVTGMSGRSVGSTAKPTVGAAGPCSGAKETGWWWLLTDMGTVAGIGAGVGLGPGAGIGASTGPSSGPVTGDRLAGMGDAARLGTSTGPNSGAVERGGVSTSIGN